jgi:hypothetical protein
MAHGDGGKMVIQTDDDRLNSEAGNVGKDVLSC